MHSLHLTEDHSNFIELSLEKNMQHLWGLWNLGELFLTEFFICPVSLSLNDVGPFWLSVSLLITSVDICQVLIYKPTILRHEYVSWHEWDKFFMFQFNWHFWMTALCLINYIPPFLRSNYSQTHSSYSLLLCKTLWRFDSELSHSTFFILS